MWMVWCMAIPVAHWPEWIRIEFGANPSFFDWKERHLFACFCFSCECSTQIFRILNWRHDPNPILHPVVFSLKNHMRSLSQARLGLTRSKSAASAKLNSPKFLIQIYIDLNIDLHIRRYMLRQRFVIFDWNSRPTSFQNFRASHHLWNTTCHSRHPEIRIAKHVSETRIFHVFLCMFQRNSCLYFFVRSVFFSPLFFVCFLFNFLMLVYSFCFLFYSCFSCVLLDRVTLSRRSF